MSKIVSIGTAVPPYQNAQASILSFMNLAYNDEVASRKLSMLFNNSGISTRYSAIPDFDLNNKSQIFRKETSNLVNVEQRLEVFKKKALPLAIKAIENSYKKIGSSIHSFGVTHLITVTCTGLYAPGIDTELIGYFNLPNDIYRTSVNFMGCNAAFHALRIADMICQTNENAKVLILCVELCTLHHQPKRNHDNLLSNTIFGDGAAAIIITPEHYNSNSKYPHLKIQGFYSLLLKEGKNLMGWDVNPVNFEMILDAKVSKFIGSNIKDIVHKALVKFEKNKENIHKWAIHPGGKKIVDSIKKHLALNDDDLEATYKVLNEYGNMSSPTILFVLNRLMESNCQDKNIIFSLGFGPGLSIETALFQYSK